MYRCARCSETAPSCAHHLTGDDELLHLARALIDAQWSDLTVQALYDLTAAHTEAAEDLHRTIDHLLRAFGGRELRHRGFARGARALHVSKPGGTIGEQCRRVDGQRHVGDR